MMAADTDQGRAVALPRLTAALYVVMALVMAGAAGLCVHGAVQSVNQAERAWVLRETADTLIDRAIAVARDGAAPSALADPLEAWLLRTAPEPDRAARVLAEARALGPEGNPRLVARQQGAAFDQTELSVSLLQAQLFLIMREDRDRGASTVLNALATRYDAGFDRRAVRDAVAAWLAGEDPPGMAERLSAMTANETRIGLLVGAGLRLLLLSGLCLGAMFYLRRFLRDARRVMISHRL